MPYLNHKDLLLHPLQEHELPGWIEKKERNKKYYRVEKELRYQHPETKDIDIIPKGYITDGASIPRWLWTLCGAPFSGNYIEAAIIHDWRYFLAMKRKKPKGTRKDADRLFYLAMKEYGVSEFEAQTKYRAVRLFGPHW